MHAEFRKSGKAALVTVIEGFMPKGHPQFAAEKGIDWPHAFVDWSTEPNEVIAYEKDSPSTYFVIDPSGKIVARTTDFESMREALRKAMSGEYLPPSRLRR